jgi:5-methyltetrahydrofolate corrinoid/iron sulfur protein methyltransferase
MLLIGENLNVMNSVIGKAFKEMDPRPIAEEARRHKEKGMDWIDINLGPARKGGPELMEFVVKTVQDEIGDSVPLCLDTSNIEAMEAGLAVHRGKAIINSIMCRGASQGREREGCIGRGPDILCESGRGLQ